MNPHPVHWTLKEWPRAGLRAHIPAPATGEAFGLRWTIKRIYLFGSEEIKSPIFYGGPNKSLSWQVKVCFKRMVDNIEYFSVHLLLSDIGDGDASPNRSVRARFKMTLVEGGGRPGKEAGGPTMNPLEFKKLYSWGYSRFLLSSDLNSPLNRFVNNDSVTICCNVWLVL